ncbi:MAG: aminotransferase class V-fold PLP-dependent enzyme [Bacteriovorax sp.]|nr:aminotransferase class V-fold PLP-dependent enzyme [Bacteriovorax sp.]
MISKFKEAFFQSTKHIHMNNGGLAPINKFARDRVTYWNNRFYEEGFFTDLEYVEDIKMSRIHLAKLIGCDSTEIAYFQSTASAVSQLCMQFPLEAGDEVITWAEEYGSHLFPWQEACKRKKAHLVMVKSPENLSAPYQLLVEKITPKTKVIAISWVQFLTGARTDLEALGKITKEKNIFLFVDVIQGLGLHPFDMKKWGVDAIASGCHKWLFSPIGVGFLALDQKHMKMIRPHNIGAYTFGTCDDPTDSICEPKLDALKFEAGSKQVLEITALGASVKFINEIGVADIEKETLRLATLLRTGLEKKGHKIHSPYELSNHQTAMVNFIPKDNTIEALRSINCNFAIRGPGVRLSPAAFTTDAVIEKVLSVL